MGSIVKQVRAVCRKGPEIGIVTIPSVSPRAKGDGFSCRFSKFAIRFFRSRRLLVSRVSCGYLCGRRPVRHRKLLFPSSGVEHCLGLPRKRPRVVAKRYSAGKGKASCFIVPVLRGCSRSCCYISYIYSGATSCRVRCRGTTGVLIGGGMRRYRFRQGSNNSHITVRIGGHIRGGN